MGEDLSLHGLRVFIELDDIQTDSIAVSDGHKAWHTTDLVESDGLLGIAFRRGGGSCGVSDLLRRRVFTGWQ